MAPTVVPYLRGARDAQVRAAGYHQIPVMRVHLPVLKHGVMDQEAGRVWDRRLHREKGEGDAVCQASPGPMR